MTDDEKAELRNMIREECQANFKDLVTKLAEIEKQVEHLTKLFNYAAHQQGWNYARH